VRRRVHQSVVNLLRQALTGNSCSQPLPDTQRSGTSNWLMNTAEPDIDQQAELSGSSLARVDWPIMLHMGARADEMARNDLPYILDLPH
jgi:hypothetical protein